MKQRIYIDSSVIGGCEDEEFSYWSKKLMQEFNLGLKIPVVSNLTREEIPFAPEKVKRVLKKLDELEVENILREQE